MKESSALQTSGRLTHKYFIIVFSHRVLHYLNQLSWCIGMILLNIRARVLHRTLSHWGSKGVERGGLLWVPFLLHSALSTLGISSLGWCKQLLCLVLNVFPLFLHNPMQILCVL